MSKENFNFKTARYYSCTSPDEASSAQDNDDEALVLWLMRSASLPYRECTLVPDFWLNIRAMSDVEAKDQFRFTVGELTYLAHCLKHLALEALGVCLQRLKYPKRWIDNVKLTWLECLEERHPRSATFISE